MRHASRRGTTLVELLVVLAILGVVATVVSFALSESTSAAQSGGGADPAIAAIHSARREAVRAGELVTIELPATPRAANTTGVRTLRYATVLPDGSVITDRSVSIDALSGARRPTAPTAGPR